MSTAIALLYQTKEPSRAQIENKVQVQRVGLVFPLLFSEKLQFGLKYIVFSLKVNVTSELWILPESQESSVYALFPHLSL